MMAASFTRGLLLPSGHHILRPPSASARCCCSITKSCPTLQPHRLGTPGSSVIGALQEARSLPCLGLQGFDLWPWILSASGTSGRTYLSSGGRLDSPVKRQDMHPPLHKAFQAPHSQPHSEPSTTAILPGADSHGTASSMAAGMEHVSIICSEPDTKMSFTNTR